MCFFITQLHSFCLVLFRVHLVFISRIITELPDSHAQALLLKQCIDSRRDKHIQARFTQGVYSLMVPRGSQGLMWCPTTSHVPPRASSGLSWLPSPLPVLSWVSSFSIQQEPLERPGVLCESRSHRQSDNPGRRCLRRHQRVTQCVQGAVILSLKCVGEMVLEGVHRSEAGAEENQLEGP